MCGLLFLLACWCRWTRGHVFSLDLSRACFHFYSKWYMQKFSQRSKHDALLSLELPFYETAQGFKMMPGETCVSGDVWRNMQGLGRHLRLLPLTCIASRACGSNNLSYRLSMTFLEHVCLGPWAEVERPCHVGEYFSLSDEARWLASNLYSVISILLYHKHRKDDIGVEVGCLLESQLGSLWFIFQGAREPQEEKGQHCEVLKTLTQELNEAAWVAIKNTIDQAA